jgi:hypothetical protein
MANPCGEEVRDAMRNHRIGFIDTPAQGNIRPAEVIWCADNGCYTSGFPGEEKWLAWLARHAHAASTCLFATAPDVVGNAVATLQRSLPLLPRIRQLGYRAAMVAQDGLEALPAPWVIPWDEFDVLFIGGSTSWKMGQHARDLVAQAKARGKWVHMGRVNSGKRFQYAEAIGCDSVDGTYLTYGPQKNLPKLMSWVNTAEKEPGLRLDFSTHQQAAA